MDTNSKAHVFQLTSGDKKSEFNAVDFKTKSQWMSGSYNVGHPNEKMYNAFHNFRLVFAALHLAIAKSNNKMSYQRTLALKRKSGREAILQKKMEEEKRGNQAKAQLMQQEAELEAEKLVSFY